MNQMQPVNLGIVGCGVIGTIHARAAAQSPLINLVAVADLRPEAAQAVAAACGVETVYPDAPSLLADPRIEGVVLAMPAHVRTELALAAFAAGKHVLTEKPVAMNAAEVRRMLAAQGDRVAGCCSSRFHFLPSTRRVTEFIAQGSLGSLRVVRCRAVKPAGRPPTAPPPPWRLNRALNGGGIMSNWGCYDLDYLLGITGWSLQPRQVLAQAWPVPDHFMSHVAPDSDAETHVSALIQCAGGTVIAFERGEFVATAGEEAWQIVGDRGSLRLRMTPGPGKVLYHDEAHADEGIHTRILWQGDEDYDSVHPGPIQDFALAIREGRQPQTDLRRALVVQQITDAIYASAAQGAAVDIEDPNP